MRRALVLATGIWLIPSAVFACTWCAASAFGDRTFNWPYLSLIVAPFVVGSAIAGVLAYHAWMPRRTAPGRAAPIPGEGGDPQPALPFDKETT